MPEVLGSLLYSNRHPNSLKSWKHAVRTDTHPQKLNLLFLAVFRKIPISNVKDICTKEFYLHSFWKKVCSLKKSKRFRACNLFRRMEMFILIFQIVSTNHFYQKCQKFSRLCCFRNYRKIIFLATRTEGKSKSLRYYERIIFQKEAEEMTRFAEITLWNI